MDWESSDDEGAGPEGLFTETAEAGLPAPDRRRTHIIGYRRVPIRVRVGVRNRANLEDSAPIQGPVHGPIQGPIQESEGLVSLVKSLLVSDADSDYQKVIQNFRADPEINPNWYINYTHARHHKLNNGQFLALDNHFRYTNKHYLWAIINKFGSFEDLLYFFQRPGLFDYLNKIKFTDRVSPAQVSQMITVFKNMAVKRDQLDPNLRNYFGFKPSTLPGPDFEEFNLSEPHFRLPIVTPHGTSKKLKIIGPRCFGCFETNKRTQLRFKGPARCKCQFHLECALNLVVSFINQISDPNPLERKIISCPGCQGEIRPSFLFEVKNNIGSLKSILENFKYLPKNFIIDYHSELWFLTKLDLVDLNRRIFILNFQKHPNFVACPKANCQGFSLIEPDLEINTYCSICYQKSLFIGKKRQLEREKDRPEVEQLLASTNRIRPCYHCGKLIEKINGCDSMSCSCCGKYFDWGHAKDYPAHHEISVHF